MKTKLILFIIFSSFILKGNTINNPQIEYVCIDPLAQNYFEYLDPNAEMWSQSLFNPESSSYNSTLADSYEVDNSTCTYTEICQSIDFPAGWSLFSTYIETDNMNAYTYFTQMFNSSSQIILLDENGSACLYEWLYCAIPYIEIHEAYQIKLSEAQTREFCGIQHLPELTPIPINEGWNLIPYLRTTPQDATEALSDIVEEIIIVKDSYGMAYIPVYNYNGIGDLEPGQGYQIKMNSEQTLIYDAND